MKQKKNKIKTKDMAYMGMCAAVLSACSQISIPMPSGVPITLQTFAVALTGAVLSWKLGSMTVILYILLGAAGLPVFTGFRGGVQVLAGYAGGFVWGFVFLAMFCGMSILQKNRIQSVLLGNIGLMLCHVLGCVQFMFLAKGSFAEAFFLVSMPYLLKDMIFVAGGIAVGRKIRKQLVKAGML